MVEESEGDSTQVTCEKYFSFYGTVITNWISFSHGVKFSPNEDLLDQVNASGRNSSTVTTCSTSNSTCSVTREGQVVRRRAAIVNVTRVSPANNNGSNVLASKDPTISVQSYCNSNSIDSKLDVNDAYRKLLQHSVSWFVQFVQEFVKQAEQLKQVYSWCKGVLSIDSSSVPALIYQKEEPTMLSIMDQVRTIEKCTLNQLHTN